jgi:hypothetical protein
MTETVDLAPLVAKLVQKSEAGGLGWSAVDGGAELPMADLVVRITRQGDGGAVQYRLDLLADDDVLIDTITEGEPGTPLARLHQLATARLRAVAIEKLMTALDRPPTSYPPIVLPALPTADDQRQLFAAMAGTWVLSNTLGKETAEITPEGRYTTLSQGGITFSPKLQLKLIAFNRSTMRIEIAKDVFADGRRLQIEVLELDDLDRPTRMAGEAKHDRHKLVYVRQA